jgi:hypothetical protein
VRVGLWGGDHQNRLTGLFFAWPTALQPYLAACSCDCPHRQQGWRACSAQRSDVVAALSEGVPVLHLTAAQHANFNVTHTERPAVLWVTAGRLEAPKGCNGRNPAVLDAARGGSVLTGARGHLAADAPAGAVHLYIPLVHC